MEPSEDKTFDARLRAENVAVNEIVAASVDTERALARVKRNAARRERPVSGRSEHRAIVAVDVASFAVADPALAVAYLRTEQGLFDVLRSAFDESGILWNTCHVEERGDGVLILVPPEFPKVWLADQWQSRLLAGLRRHYATHAPGVRVRLRVALHYGEVHANSDGVISQAANLAFRILDAEAAKAALAASRGMLAVIASNEFYHDVVSQEPAAEPSSYRRIPVSVKQTETVAWLRLPGTTDTAAYPSITIHGSRAQIDASLDASDRPPTTAVLGLVDALLELPFLRDPAGRTLLIDLLPPVIATAVPYHPTGRLHILTLVQTCMRHDNGLATLVETIRQLDGDSPAVRRLEAVSLGR
jgi:hypothetical protein